MHGVRWMCHVDSLICIPGGRDTRPGVTRSAGFLHEALVVAREQFGIELVNKVECNTNNNQDYIKLLHIPNSRAFIGISRTLGLTVYPR